MEARVGAGGTVGAAGWTEKGVPSREATWAKRRTCGVVRCFWETEFDAVEKAS